MESYNVFFKDILLNVYNSTPKLRAAILYFVKRFPEKLNRVSLSKYLYYTHGYYFQKMQSHFFEVPFLHAEGSPEPLFFSEILLKMNERGEIEIVPFISTEAFEGKPITVLKGLVFKTSQNPPEIFTKPEKKALQTVAYTLAGDLSLETRYFPVLYQNYTGTGLYDIIPQPEITQSSKPNLSFRAWARKVFRLMWQ